MSLLSRRLARETNPPHRSHFRLAVGVYLAVEHLHELIDEGKPRAESRRRPILSFRGLPKGRKKATHKNESAGRRGCTPTSTPALLAATTNRRPHSARSVNRCPPYFAAVARMVRPSSRDQSPGVVYSLHRCATPCDRLAQPTRHRLDGFVTNGHGRQRTRRRKWTSHRPRPASSPNHPKNPFDTDVHHDCRIHPRR